MVAGTIETGLETKPRHFHAESVPWWLYRLFFLSGISGLLYEIVWTRMLTRILGSTVYATSTVLAAFMAGLALGSLVAGRAIDRTKRPLLWYAALEVGIGLFALLSLALPDRLLPVYRFFYEASGESRAWLTAGQVVVCLVLLLLPTSLMGATLPTLCAYGVRYNESFGRYVSTLYSLNTLGAVVGVLAAGFVLIGEVGETNTILAGVVLNIAVALAVLVLPKPASSPPVAASYRPDTAPHGAGSEATASFQYSDRVRLAVAICFAANGFAALAYEVVWTRMLITFAGTSIYAFSIVLAEVLLGMMIGSYFIGKYVDRWRDPLAQFARLQLAAGLVIALVLHVFSHLGSNPLGTAVVLLSPIVLGVLWGSTFSAAARCYVGDHSAVGRRIGQLYAWNTVGCIAGAAVSGFVLIPLLGAGRCAIVLAGVNLVACMVLLAVHAQGWLNKRWVTEFALVAAGVALLATAGDPYYQLLLRRMEEDNKGPVVVYRHVEEAAGTTTAFSSPDNDRLHKHLWVNGQGMTSLVSVTKLMAHLPIWMSDDPHDALVICFGMGTTVRSASRHDGLNVSAVELAPGVLASCGLYHQDMPEILRQPAVRAYVDDGRNFLLMHNRQYDVITIDPAPPLYSAGIVNLYTREFFQLCKDRTRAGGVVCLWIPPDRRSEIEMIARTFLDVFDHVSAWSGPSTEETLNDGLILIGSRQRIEHVTERIDRGFRSASVAADLAEWGTGCDQPRKIQDLFVADEVALRSLLANTKVITDDRPYTEFYLWRSILDRSKYDEPLTGSDVRQRAEKIEQSP